jgi:uncharacterized protein YegL
MEQELYARVNEDNPDPRIAVALLLDTSSSMSGEPIRQLNEGFQVFCDEIKADDLAQKRTEVSVITFGGTARVQIPFTEGRDLQPQTLVAKGATPMGAALDLGLDELGAQKQAYKESGLEYYRPWLFLITDGTPTDPEQFASAAERVRQAEAAKALTCFTVGVGDQADINTLAQLSDVREPVRLQGLSFKEMFLWLSASMHAVSDSGTFSSNDEGVSQAEATQGFGLPSPKGWAQW